MVLSAPDVLIVFRAACAPALVVLACLGFPGPRLAAKYGRIASYHMWSSKALGVLIVITMTSMFIAGRPNVLVAVTLWAAVANELEGFLVSVSLPHWSVDVPSLVHAWRGARREPKV